MRLISASTSVAVVSLYGRWAAMSGLALLSSPSRLSGPMRGLMPHRVTISRAIIVTCWRSFSAPVVTTP